MNSVETMTQAARGMHDILPGKSADYLKIETAARRIFSLFGYREIRTPMLEPLSLFERALGQTTDVVEKEMFTLKDRGGRTLCLRPEGTAGVVRSFIENSLWKKSPLVKLFYLGSMFRAERPQKGRLREFAQIGSEYFGNDSPAADAETIQLALEILGSVGVRAWELQLNSIGCAECRPQYQALLLKFLRKQFTQLCSNCKNRIDKNPLRALDCKLDREQLAGVPESQNHLCPRCREHHEQLKKLLSSARVAFKIVPHLVRGLDYYTRTVFEIYPSGKTGSQDALAAGGRYDTLVQDLGGEKVPAVGFAMGIERVLNFLDEQGIETVENKKRGQAVFVAALGNDSIEKSFQILSQLRAQGWEAEAVLNNQSLKSQMRLADSLGMKFCIIIGEDELKQNVVTLRDLNAQSQEKVPMAELFARLKKESK